MRLTSRASGQDSNLLNMCMNDKEAASTSSMAQDHDLVEPEDTGEQTRSEAEDIDNTLDESQIAEQIVPSGPNNPSGSGGNQDNAIIIPDDGIPALDLAKQTAVTQIRRSARIRVMAATSALRLLAAPPSILNPPSAPRKPRTPAPHKCPAKPMPTASLSPEDPSIPTTDHCLLFTLPGELRNRIYRHVLLSPFCILLTRTSWSTHEPPLLRTCRQIRAEATQLFYYENDFSAEILDYDGSVNNRFHALRTRYKTLRRQAHHHFSGGPSWGNLVGWLEELHKGAMVEIHSPGLDKARTVERKVVGACFRIVLGCKSMSWWVVRELLESQHVVLAQIDERWT